MAKCRKAPKESLIGPAVYDPDGRQCWFCLNNKVSELCCNCLNMTNLFEASKGNLGEYKPAWEYGSPDERWQKGSD